MRSATVIAAALALVITGVAAGAAGDFMVLGQVNSSGSSQTVLTNSGFGAAFTLQTTNAASGATGIFGWSNQTGSASTRGVYGRADGSNSYGVYGSNTGTDGDGAAIFADGGDNVGIRVTTDDANGIIVEPGCEGFCGATGIQSNAAGLGTGVIGNGGLVGVQGDGAIGVSAIGTSLAISADGDVDITGDLSVSGTCTGCTTSALAVNDSGKALEAGTAVTATGVTTDAEGTVLILVRPAADGDEVIGVVDSAMESIEQDLSIDSTTRLYQSAGSTASDGGVVRVVTSGIAVFSGSGMTSGLGAGDHLSVASAPGKIGVAASDDASFGTMLGTLDDGRVVVYVGAP